MMTDSSKIHWSRRVPRHKVRRLYESDARGMLDEDLLEDVGFRIFVRCQAVVDVTEASKGGVKMCKTELIEAIDRVAPNRFAAW